MPATPPHTHACARMQAPIPTGACTHVHAYAGTHTHNEETCRVVSNGVVKTDGRNSQLGLWDLVTGSMVAAGGGGGAGGTGGERNRERLCKEE